MTAVTHREERATPLSPGGEQAHRGGPNLIGVPLGSLVAGRYNAFLPARNPPSGISLEEPMLRTLVTAATAMIVAVSPSAAQHAHQEHGPAPDRLGTVHFETSCDAGVQAEFNRGVALLHSFWFRAAIESFERVLQKDTSCGIAYWGLALTHWGNPFAGLKPPAVLEPGAKAAEKGLAAGAPTDRERAYIAAVAELYRDYETLPQRTRTVAYEEAMQRLSARYPQDREAAAFYALSINQNAQAGDQSYAKQLQAAAILERLFAEQPDHPGLAHYIIHAYDHPPLAEKALHAARAYAKIAPDAPHALHMPSHTFTRVGAWEDSVASNRDSAEAARRANSPGEVLHAYDYQVYAYLQMAQDRDAARVLDDMAAAVAALDPANVYANAGQYAQAAIPARIALERGAWQDAATLRPVETRFPFVAAITHFARALGAARSGNPAAARGDIDRLGELHRTLVAAKDDYWAEQVRIQQMVADAWATFASGRKDEGLRMLRAAADAEDKTDKSAISPGPLAPARELLGDMLLEAGQPAAALAEFELTMAKEPNRFRGIAGAARAAVATGDRARASALYTQLLDLAAKADPNARPALLEASRFVAQR
jgi:hypothetical protein